LYRFYATAFCSRFCGRDHAVEWNSDESTKQAHTLPLKQDNRKERFTANNLFGATERKMFLLLPRSVSEKTVINSSATHRFYPQERIERETEKREKVFHFPERGKS
jgi:hypothetical protein